MNPSKSQIVVNDQARNKPTSYWDYVLIHLVLFVGWVIFRLWLEVSIKTLLIGLAVIVLTIVGTKLFWRILTR